MALRQGWMENVRALAGLLLGVLGVPDGVSMRRGPGEFHIARSGRRSGLVSRGLEAELERRRNLAVLVCRSSQIR